MFGMTIIRTAELPFYRDITALIKRNPEYLEGIRDGVVHLAFDPKRKPKPTAAAYRDEQGALERNDTGL